jgi:hypothetical protein
MTGPVGRFPVPQQIRGQLASTRVGRRYQRLYTAHERQLEFLVAVHPDVRDHIITAVQEICAAGVSERLDDGTLAAASRVLDDLDRLGDVELRSIVGQLRDELVMARGRTLCQVLADH